MGRVEVLWDGDGVPALGMDRQAPVKKVLSCCTTYAGGNKIRQAQDL